MVQANHSGSDEKYGGAQYTTFFSTFSPEDLDIMIEYEIITSIYKIKTCSLNPL